MLVEAFGPSFACAHIPTPAAICWPRSPRFVVPQPQRPTLSRLDYCRLQAVQQPPSQQAAGQQQPSLCPPQDDEAADGARSWRQPRPLLLSLFAAASLLAGGAAGASGEGRDFYAPSSRASRIDEDAFTNIPSELSSSGTEPAPRLSELMKGPKAKEIQACTRKCVPTCVRGGEGTPGLGPLTMRKDPVVFKEGFRSRTYCLSECTQVCALKENKGLAAK